MIHLDTHVVMWLYQGLPAKLPRRARRVVDGDPDIRVSPMVALELGLLTELGRATRPPDLVLAALQQAMGLTMSAAQFPVIVRHAQQLTWTRDPFDRLIVANALADGADLVTADHRIRTHLPTAVWD